MTPEENKKVVLANDNDIKRQVPGITTKKEKTKHLDSHRQQLKNEELFFRAIGR